MDAPVGLIEAGAPAKPDALAQAQLPAAAAALWGRWDGIEFAGGEAKLFSLAEQAQASAEASAAGILRAGDRAIGQYGLALLVLPADPWEEGGDVVMVEEDGERSPYASSVVRLGLGLVAELSVLYDDEGEYREDLFGDDGQLTARVERRLVRRRLDFDEDAAFPRFRLGQLLRRAGELRAARSELRRVLRCAPEFAWAHWELGRVALELADWAEAGAPPRAGAPAADRPAQGRPAPEIRPADARQEARESFAAAAEKAGDPHLRALFLAWEARVAQLADEPGRVALAAAIKRLDPGFVAAREAGLREAIEDGDGGRARELLALGLAVEPRALALLELRATVAELPELVDECEPEVIEEVEEALDLPDEDAPPGGERRPVPAKPPATSKKPAGNKPAGRKRSGGKRSGAKR